MPTKRLVQVDPTRSLQLNLVSQSPHVVAYRVWVRPAGGEWAVVAQGQTTDNNAEFYTLGPYPTGTLLDYWLGVGGNPFTDWSALVTLSQDGHMVPGGSWPERGQTDDGGVDVKETEVRFV